MLDSLICLGFMYPAFEAFLYTNTNEHCVSPYENMWPNMTVVSRGSVSRSSVLPFDANKTIYTTYFRRGIQ
jgi:hypothetical protein